MAQGARADRVGEQIRQELSQILSQQAHDPGIGFLTLTRVKVTPDLQLARVLYTVFGDEKQKKETQKALERALPYLRRQIGSRLSLRRVPELQFFYDQAVEHQDRIEQILIDLKREREENPLPQDMDELPSSEAGSSDPANAPPAGRPDDADES
ncbi:MAG: 30S ribosome-binding factor RbfA [Acidobacteria bacterium]|jgi:ribosome-binding factor A|nr:30S ribosome-binding factor RbfA [Acidobacteriota bacterium]